MDSNTADSTLWRLVDPNKPIRQILFGVVLAIIIAMLLLPSLLNDTPQPRERTVEYRKNEIIMEDICQQLKQMNITLERMRKK